MSMLELVPWRKDRRQMTGELADDWLMPLHHQIDRVFTDFFGADLPRLARTRWDGEFSPSMDVSETDRQLEVTAELPGMDDKDIEVTLTDGVLTVKGEKRSESEEEDKDKDKDKHHYRLERSYGAFRRSFRLPRRSTPTTCRPASTRCPEGHRRQEGGGRVGDQEDRGEQGGVGIARAGRGLPATAFPPPSRARDRGGASRGAAPAVHSPATGGFLGVVTRTGAARHIIAAGMPRQRATMHLDTDAFGQQHGRRRRVQGPVFRTRALTRLYRTGEVEVRALDGVDIELPEGETTVLLGPSGSGKSTFLNIVGGLDRPTSGTVHFRDRELTALGERELTRYRRDHVGFVFQFYNLIPSLTAWENVALTTEIARDPMTPDEALALVGLQERKHHFPAQLSGGEQQRVATARAIAKRPEVLLCDEPTGALDSKTGIRVLEALAKVNEELSTTVVIITHNAAIRRIAHRVVHFIDGTVSRIRINETRIRPAEVVW